MRAANMRCRRCPAAAALTRRRSRTGRTAASCPADSPRCASASAACATAPAPPRRRPAGRAVGSSSTPSPTSTPARRSGMGRRPDRRSPAAPPGSQSGSLPHAPPPARPVPTDESHPATVAHRPWLSSHSSPLAAPGQQRGIRKRRPPSLRRAERPVPGQDRRAHMLGGVGGRALREGRAESATAPVRARAPTCHARANTALPSPFSENQTNKRSSTS
jgi:hypothetical protein